MFLATLFGKTKSAVNGVNLDPYYEDENYTDPQSFLKTYGKNLLEGNIPSYYKSIGETNSPEIQEYLRRSNSEISRGISEAVARGGRARGGLLPSLTASAVAQNDAGIRWQDYLRAMGGKLFLFGQGRGITEGVRAAGLDNQGMKNTYNLNKANFLLDKAKYKDEMSAKRGQMIGRILGTIGGFMVGGPAGGAIGGEAGSQIGGGNVPGTGMFGGKVGGSTQSEILGYDTRAYRTY